MLISLQIYLDRVEVPILEYFKSLEFEHPKLMIGIPVHGRVEFLFLIVQQKVYVKVLCLLHQL